MENFDLDSLLRFTPPRCICERCFAFLGEEAAQPAFRCPVCEVVYVPTEEYPSAEHYLRARGLGLAFDNLIAHSQHLALIARRARLGMSGQPSDYSPMRALLEAIDTAQRCIHFTTFGLSALMIGVLKLAAQRVDVRGIVSGIKRDEMYRELTSHADDAPRLTTRLFGQNSQWFPHQKLIIIDGLIAFKGSANLTDIGWRKAAHGQEVIEMVTDVRDVCELNNRFFSPVWAGFETKTTKSAAIQMASHYGRV